MQLHRIVYFLREVADNRSYNFSRRHHDSTLPKLLLKLDIEYGCSNFVIAMKISLTLNGQTRLAESCEKGLNYTVIQLNNETEIIECYKLTGHQHSSQARFSLVIKKEFPNFHPISPSHTSSNSSSSSYSLNSIAASDLLPVKELSELLLKAEEASMSDHVPIMFYEVESRKKEGLVDIVAIYPNGSICSTGSNFANYGLPCELEMAVFFASLIHINMCLNFHPIHQVPHLKDLGVENFKILTVAHDKVFNNPLSITCDASWDYAINDTDDEWNNIGLGGEDLMYIRNPVQKGSRSNKDNIVEAIKKDWHYIQPLINQDEEARMAFFQFVDNQWERMAIKAVQKVKLSRKVLGYSDDIEVRNDIPLSVTEIVPMNIKDKSNKRKVSGESKKLKQ